MSYRKDPLVENGVYHIYSRSIAGYEIFGNDKDRSRMLKTIAFYAVKDPGCKFSWFTQYKNKHMSTIVSLTSGSEKLIEILAYCLMPTHLHLVLKQIAKDGISKFLNLILKSYSAYFNNKHNRKGPLWESRFKNIPITDDGYLFHLIRYIHLNPTSSDSRINKPEDWKYSSYREYLDLVPENERLCSFSEYLDVNPDSYREYTNDRMDYQRKLSKIKHLTLE